jgi:periplasmic protein TonB
MPKTNQHRALLGPLAAALCAGIFAFGAHANPLDARPVSQVEPEFPREALVAGASQGKVRARVSINAAGEVVRVEILEANPRRVFDRAVVKTLSRWKFTPGSDGRSREIDVDFRR